MPKLESSYVSWGNTPGRIEVGNGTTGSVVFGNDSQAHKTQITGYRNSSMYTIDLTLDNSVIMRFRNNGAGQIIRYATIQDGSDDRLKFNETPITNALATVRQLNPQTYDKAVSLADLTTRHLDCGFIAQEVQQIPELAHHVLPGSESEPYTLNYQALFVHSIAALKELDLTVQALETRLTNAGF